MPFVFKKKDVCVPVHIVSYEFGVIESLSCDWTARSECPSSHPSPFITWVLVWMCARVLYTSQMTDLITFCTLCFFFFFFCSSTFRERNRRLTSSPPLTPSDVRASCPVLLRRRRGSSHQRREALRLAARRRTPRDGLARRHQGDKPAPRVRWKSDSRREAQANCPLGPRWVSGQQGARHDPRRARLQARARVGGRAPRWT